MLITKAPGLERYFMWRAKLSTNQLRSSLLKLSASFARYPEKSWMSLRAFPADIPTTTGMEETLGCSRGCAKHIVDRLLMHSSQSVLELAILVAMNTPDIKSLC